MKTIYQVMIISHESREVKLCDGLYESREKAQRALFRLLDNPYIKGEEETCGEVGEQKYTVAILARLCLSTLRYVRREKEMIHMR